MKGREEGGEKRTRGGNQTKHEEREKSYSSNKGGINSQREGKHQKRQATGSMLTKGER